MTKEEIRAWMLAHGADNAAVIQQSSVVLNPEFRAVCAQNSCGGYGQCWMCPPDAGDIFDLMRKVRGYQYGILYQTISPLEDSFDLEGINEASARHVRLSQAVQPLLPPKAMHLSCGGCRVCERCAKRDNLPCRFPEKAMTSLEACGIDVARTTASTPLRYTNGANTVTFFGLILL